MGANGVPATILVGHVDDFLLHSPTVTKCLASLKVFFEYALEIGLLCNPKKTEGPSQCLKYCGFLYDTRDVPILRIPPNKRSRAQAMISYVLSKHGSTVPNLCMAVLTGVLQSFVDATPGRIGNTFLRHLYDLIHDPSLPSEMAQTKYYEHVTLTRGALSELKWRFHFLNLPVGRIFCPAAMGTLRATFGDSSGTGTGRSGEDVSALLDGGLQVWMGTWSPLVDSFRGASSNWKELNTLLLTLCRERDRVGRYPDHRWLFYFTDNLVTYFIAMAGASRSPGLHDLIMKSSALN